LAHKLPLEQYIRYPDAPKLNLTAEASGDKVLVIKDQTGTETYSISSAGAPVRTGVELQLGRGGWKVGTTAGWTVAAAANLYQATLAASQTGSTLVIPVDGLKVGDTITAFKVVGQIESAGGTVTVDADLRKLINAAADPTDESVGAITQVSVTADTAMATSKTGLTDVVGADEWYYLLITATTAASTDIRFLGATVTVTTS
jgi:hypothetical protein